MPKLIVNSVVSYFEISIDFSAVEILLTLKIKQQCLHVKLNADRFRIKN